MDATSDIAGLEEMTGRSALHVNGRTGFGWSLPPNIERARAAREPKPAPSIVPKVAAPETVHAFPATEITCYSELISALKEQIGVMGVRYEDFDSLVDWASGLAGKVFGPMETKRLGPEKMFDAIRAAGLRLRVEVDPEQQAKMKVRISQNFNPRNAMQARTDSHWRTQCPPSEKMIDRVLIYLANNKPGGMRRLNDAVKAARSNWARQTALRGLRDDRGRFAGRYQKG
jgi:hypothetical protein